MKVKIALAGNPNSGKTTLFNALTGSNQYVGNWPGVTVEKKEGRLKSDKDVMIYDLPGIYSFSPYTLEEVVSRNYLLTEEPDVILNIVDGSNLERNLYLTTQLLELGIPVVVAINMIDVVKKNGDVINLKKLSDELGCPVVEISALKGTGINEAARCAIEAARQAEFSSYCGFSEATEGYLNEIESRILNVNASQRRFFAIKLFENDDKIGELLKTVPNVSDVIERAEAETDDDTESIITNERYTYIARIIKSCYKKNTKKTETISDKIDKVVTNRFLALPIFAAVMFIVYYISVTTIGSIGTDWANDGVFGEGWHLFGIGSSAYSEAVEEWEEATAEEEEALEEDETDDILTEEADEAEAGDIETAEELEDEISEPDPADYGVWIPGIPVLIGNVLEKIGTADWLNSLILDGIVGGVGAVLGFVPQILILFIFLAFLEGCGYMARIAFIMDRIFRKFGLSGKSFIPMLIGSGCGIPGIMASRTIENERDRRMTIMTTTFIPCGAKLPIIALIAGALFNNAPWVAPSAYFVGIAAIVVSGIILKKTKIFAGDPAPFVMELPAYHIPTVGSVLRSMWERGWSFIKKAGTIILLSTIVLWFLQGFGVENGSFGMVEDLNNSLLASIGGVFAPIFTPLGWGDWKAAVAAVTGLIAKENVVGTFGILFGFAEVAEDGAEIWSTLQTYFSTASAYSFLVFNLLCAPCFAAIGAIRREMNSAKWTWFAIAYQTCFAYVVSFCIYQLGKLFLGGAFGFGAILSVIIIAVFVFLLVRPYKESKTLTLNVSNMKG